MSTSVTPAHTTFSQDTILLPGFETDQSVTILQIMRNISPRRATPPYARDQYVTTFNQFYILIARIPIARQDTSQNMDFFAILVHREGALEETVMIPVPASFFEDHFLPDDPSSSSLTLTPNTTPPVLPSASITTAEPPSIHRYPPPTHHIAQQLGEAHQSQSWTWKGLMEDVWLYILVIGLGLVIIGVLVIASTFH
ncbi:hypothetical protein M422DRAFT_239505 [Sphaerobolus stellatus SS14]|nr:hypothetical protein M422DRAFT_239505 [Sphaerobolus stellatus SS14]